MKQRKKKFIGYKQNAVNENANKMVDLDDYTLDILDKSSSRIHGVNRLNASEVFRW